MTRNRLLLILAFLAFIYLFIRTAWVGDDVYITLRTVDNLVNGYGPVWNVAERVQSYTHPLWMLLFTAIYAPTRDAYFTALFASFLASFVTLYLVTRREGFVALGVVTLFLSKAFTDYSASGLENPLTHVLLALFFIAFAEKEASLLRLSLIAAFIALNRQDAILFVLPALAYQFLQPLTSLHGVERSQAIKRSISQILLGFLPLILWEAFSLFYYGFPFPNTYYAKLGAGIPQNELFAQGLVYFRDSIQRDPVTLVTIFAATLLAAWRGGMRERLLALGSMLYLGYVVYIGGDFMSGRFFTASLLVGVLLLIRLTRDMEVQPRRIVLMVVVILGLLASPPTFLPSLNQPRFTDEDMKTGINDERAYYYPISGLLNYRPDRQVPFSKEGWVEHGRLLRMSGKTVVDEKNVGFIGYYAGPEVHIVDVYALCDPLLARLPAWWSGQWRIGHYERVVPDGYLATLRTGQNQISDPDIAAFYDQLALVTRGPLFSRARLLAVWKFNTGQFDHLILPELPQ